MRTSRFWIQALLVVSLITACGLPGQSTEAPPLADIPTITPLGDPSDSATPTAGETAGDSTPETTPSEGPTSSSGEMSPTDQADFAEGKKALAEGDFEGAVDYIGPVYTANSDNEEVATLLATAYDQWGLAMMKDKPAAIDSTREAFEKFDLGEEVAPDSSEIKETVAKHKDASTAMLQGLSALDKLDKLIADEAPLDEVNTQVTTATTSLATVKELDESFSGLLELSYRTYLTAAKAQELAAKAEDTRAAKEPFWREARDLCTQARDVWPEGSEQAKEARACIARMSENLDPKPTATKAPPTPTKAPPTPTKPQVQPTRPPPPPPPPPAGPISFAAIIQAGHQPGEKTDQSASCVSGRVVLANGNPVAAAVGNVNNGSYEQQWVTNGNGEFNVCGLGWSNWSAVLFYIPGDRKIASPVAVPGLWLNGTASQRAVVLFKGR